MELRTVRNTVQRQKWHSAVRRARKALPAPRLPGCSGAHRRAGPQPRVKVLSTTARYSFHATAKSDKLFHLPWRVICSLLLSLLSSTIGEFPGPKLTAERSVGSKQTHQARRSRPCTHVKEPSFSSDQTLASISLPDSAFLVSALTRRGGGGQL